MPNDVVCSECRETFEVPLQGTCPVCRSRQIRRRDEISTDDAIRIIQGLIADATEDGDTEAAEALQRVLHRWQSSKPSLLGETVSVIQGAYRTMNERYY